MDGEGMRMALHPATSDITTDNADEFRDRADRRELWRAGGGSLLLHMLLLALLIGLWQMTPPDEIVLPPITVRLEGSNGAAGSPGGGGGNAPMPGQEPGTAATPKAAATPQEETPAVTPLQTAQATPPPTPKPAPKLVRPKPPPKPSPTTVMQASSVPAKPAVAPAAPAADQSVQTAAVASAAGSGQGSEGADSAGNGNVGISQGAIGTGTGSGSDDDYLDRLRRHLNRYKQYPEEAIKQKQEGTVLLGFELAHDGTVTKAWIEQSSGNPLLDQAALTMMHDASPVPPVPERYWDKKGPIILPVDFKIGFFDKVMH